MIKSRCSVSALSMPWKGISMALGGLEMTVRKGMTKQVTSLISLLKVRSAMLRPLTP